MTIGKAKYSPVQVNLSMRLNIVLYIYYICIFSCLAQTPSSTSHCRKRVEVYNNYGGVDVYLLRDDAAEENYGRCECYYKKIGT